MNTINRYLKTLCLLPLAINWTAKAQTTTFLFSGTVTSYVVPLGVTSIGIQANGAQGGNETFFSYAGGSGANMYGHFTVTPGQVLDIVVGEQPASELYIGGGGGGSFVWDASSSTLLIAGGGGGGAGYSGVGPGIDAVTTINGTNGGGGTLYGGAGTAGSGGVTPSYTFYGAGGCGWLSNGAGGLGFCSNAVGGTKPLLGAAGGSYGGTATLDGNGGFGGGGGGQGQCGATGGGGGGGYSGGGGGAGGPFPAGGGGGSYNTGTAQVNSVGNLGDGVVVITVLCVTPVAGTIVGATTVCAGSTSTLTDPTGSLGGTWSSTNTSVATVGSTTGIVRGVSAGTATISYSIVLSCGSAFATTVVTINPLPAPMSYDTILCDGSTVTFSDVTSGGTWSSRLPAIASVVSSTGFITGNAAGTTIITYTLATGCYVVSPPLSVLLIPTGISGPTSICMGYPVTYVEAATGGVWSSTDTTIAKIDSFTGLAIPVATGSTIIEYTNGCGSGAFLPITVNPLPLPITGVLNACVSLTTTLSDATPGGTWSSITPTLASVNSTSGVVTGLLGGIAMIAYTLPTTCFVTTTVTVTPPLAPIVGAPKVCLGDTTTLTESVSGGVWTGSDATLATVGSSSGLVTGISMGVVHFTYTIGSGCNAVKALTVNPIAPIAGRDSVCVGSTGYLTNIVGGGTWSSQFPAVATISIDSGLVDGITAGISTMTYTLPTGCISYANMTVIPLPPAITGSIMQVCPGQSIALGDAAPGGVWGSVNQLVASVSPAGVVTGVGADTVTIYYVIQPGCLVATPILVKHLPAPITGTEVMCPGIKDTLNSATPGGGFWTSLSPSLISVGASTGIVIAQVSATGGIATVEYTSNVTNCSITTTVSIYPAPAPSITLIDGTMYTDTGYVSYQWYDSIQGEIPDATSSNCAALYTEYYYVVVTDSSGCKGISAHFPFNASGLGVKNKIGAEISIFPNPTDGIVYIVSPVKVSAVITGMDGKKELEQTNAKTLDISRLASGVYFIGLYDETGKIVTMQKLTKQ